nr:aminodeoxychorismate synthase component I [Kordiimonas marina]
MALERLDAALAAGLHVAGWIAYECAAAFEPRLAAAIRHQADEPLIWLIATRHRDMLDQDGLAQFLQTDPHTDTTLDFGTPAQTREAYLDALAQIHAYIEAGDVYQVNHTFPLPCRLHGDVAALYARLRVSQPVAYGALIDTGETQVLSLSPELFIRRDGNRLVARPMKGTAPRGRTTAEDEAIASDLAADEKSQAENLMIVDLIRNDLSRLALPGSVKVDRLFEVERYRTLHQMTSPISAECAEGLMPSALLRALFPCGSVTGAPKVRAMEIIAELEAAPRGVYCGAIGHFSPAEAPGNGSDWCLNVPIRTLILDKDGKGRLSIGSGVVADSDAEGEYDECLLKARFAQATAPVFSLIETLGHEPGKGFIRLDRHLARLQDSADYFDIPYNEAAIRQALADHVAHDADHNRLRVRLTLSQDGTPGVSSAPLPDTADSPEPPRVCLAAERTNPSDPFLFHKTTNRSLYDAAFARAHAAGYADILFFNDRDELTEGAISNVFIVKDGKWFTPPLSAGLLPGVLRAELLESHSPGITERTISRDDLLAADAIYIGNSLRGLRAVTLAADAII